MVNKTLDWLAKQQNKWYYIPLQIIFLPVFLIFAIVSYPVRWIISKCAGK